MHVVFDCTAPNLYNGMRGLAADSMYKAYLSSTQRGAFGSTAPRQGPEVTRDSVDLPGPAHYQVTSKPESGAGRGRVIHSTSNFASQTDRMPQPQDTPFVS